MIGDFFIDIATSTAVLVAVAVIAVAAFLVAHMPSIVERFWPQAFIYAKAAALVQILACAVLMFLIGFRLADERAETKQLKNDLAFQELQLENAKATADDAEKLKAVAEAKADEAKGLLDDFRKTFGGGKADCDWTADEFGRLLHLRPSKRR